MIRNKLMESKLLILYILDIYKKPLSNVDISDIVIANNIASYFALQKHLKELEKDKYIIYSSINNISYIKISKTGKEVLEFFIKRIDDKVITKIQNYIKEKN